MKIAFKNLMAVAAFLMVGASHAAETTLPAGGYYNGLILTGTQTFNASSKMVAFANQMKAVVGNNDPAVVTTTTKVNPLTNVVSFTAISSQSPLGSFGIDTGNAQLQSAASQGGLTLATSIPTVVSAGNGALSLTNFKVDLASKKVYATITGGNGVGVQDNVALWDADILTGSTAIAPPESGNIVTKVQLSGLRFTATAQELIAKSLALSDFGVDALGAVTDAGTIDTVVEGTRQLTTCTAIYSTTRVRNGALYDNQITLRNLTTSPATGWSVSWNYKAPTLLLGVKNAKITQPSPQQFKAYVAQPVAANTTVAAGASTTVTFRSIATNQAAPTMTGMSATLGGQTCAVSVQ